MKRKHRRDKSATSHPPKLGRWWRSFSHRRRKKRHGAYRYEFIQNLAEVPPGYRARVVGFSDALPSERKEHLLAYGLVPGDWVFVIQHSPVTVIQIEHTELALEQDLAREIQVKEIQSRYHRYEIEQASE